MASDFHLPDEIVAVIPTDPYDQLDVARKITSMAIGSRVTKLEAETGRLRQKILEKDRIIYELQDRITQLEREFHQTDGRLRAILDENIKLTDEKDALTIATKKLSKDLAKLESFKRNLMQSLSDDNSSQGETVDIGTCELSVARSSSSSSLKDGEPECYSSSNEVESTVADSIGTLQMIPTSGSPRHSAAVSPKRSSGIRSPTKAYFDGQFSFSSGYTSSQQSSGSSSPPRGHSLSGHPSRTDGKAFFRQARTRLQYEQFNAFLANVKELNAHKQSREETLRKADEIFGPDNKDLYLLFQALLNRSKP